MIIDGALATAGVDKSAERLLIENCDLSSVHAGEATLCWEHQKGSPSDIIGTIRFAKKIYSIEDCDTDRQRYFWNLIRQPFIYGISRLYSGAGHPQAVSVAAQIRDHYVNNEKIICRYSIDGQTLERNNNELSVTVMRACAITVTPCNASCDLGVISDPALEQMGVEVKKTERQIGSCAMALNCLPGEGILYSDLVTPSLTKTEPSAWPDLGAFVQPVAEALVRYASEAVRAKLQKRLDLHDRALHLPAGSRPLYIPSKHSDAHAEHFRRACADLRVRSLHDRALEHWRQAHEQLRDGVVPRPQVEHALRVVGARPIREAAVQKAEWCFLDRLRKAEDGIDQPLVNATHELITRRRDDARGALGELLSREQSVPGLGPKVADLTPHRARLLLSMLGYGDLLVLDSAFAQHLFNCGQEDAHAVLAGLQGDADLRALEEAYREHDAAGGPTPLEPLPASWQHWLVAPAHAELCGLPEIGSDRSGLYELGLPTTAAGLYPPDQSAELQRSWARRYGDLAGVLLFYAHLYPALRGRTLTKSSSAGSDQDYAERWPSAGPLISAQRFRDPEIVGDKVKNRDFSVYYVPIHGYGDVIVDGHHALAAADQAGEWPKMILSPERAPGEDEDLDEWMRAQGKPMQFDSLRTSP